MKTSEVVAEIGKNTVARAQFYDDKQRLEVVLKDGRKLRTS